MSLGRSTLPTAVNGNWSPITAIPTAFFHVQAHARAVAQSATSASATSQLCMREWVTGRLRDSLSHSRGVRGLRDENTGTGFATTSPINEHRLHN